MLKKIVLLLILVSSSILYCAQTRPSQHFDLAMIGINVSQLPAKNTNSVTLGTSYMATLSLDYILNDRQAIPIGVHFLTRKSSPNDYQIVTLFTGYKHFLPYKKAHIYTGGSFNIYISRYVALGHFNSISEAAFGLGAEPYIGILLPSLLFKRQYLDLRLSYQLRALPIDIDDDGHAHAISDNTLNLTLGYYF